jgi:hypothetical protein
MRREKMTEVVTRKMVKELRPNAKAKSSGEWWLVVDGSEKLSETLCGRKAAWEFALQKLRQASKHQETNT